MNFGWMKCRLLALLIFLIVTSRLYAQSIDIPVAVFGKTRVGGCQYLEDSSDVIEMGGPLEAKFFSINFYKIKFNKKDSVLELNGKIYERVEKYGLPATVIFKAIRSNDSLTNIFQLGLSSYARKSSKNGFFKIKLKVQKDERLYFKFNFYYLREYEVCKLL